MTTTFLPNSQIDRFLIKAEVGRGGMGVVYKCFDPILKRPVALKLLASHLGHDAKALTRFRREAALVASLKHPHIAMVYDFGEVEGQPYMALEWIEGRTLKDILASEGALSVARSLVLFDQLASALDYAHQHGVVHRDLKPANIIVSHDNKTTILDFGIAWFDHEPSITTTGSILGTPLYMSPEQIQGQAIDGRSDLYSLAIMFYEMLAGQAPFESHKSNPNGLFHQQLFITPAPISELNPSISLTIEEALSKGLSKKPDKRFATGAEFSRALHALPASHSPQPKKKAWQSWLWFILPLLLMALLLTQLLPLLNQREDSPTSLITPTVASAEAGIADLIPSEEVEAEEPKEQEEEESLITDINPYQSGFIDADLSPFDEEAAWLYYPESDEGTGVVGTGEQLAFAEGNMLVVLDRGSQELLWETRLSRDVVAVPSIYLDDEIIFLFVLTEEGELYTFNLIDGRLLWHISAEEIQGTIREGITVGDDGMLYAATDRGWLYVLDPWEGEISWALELSEQEEALSRPTVINLAIFIAGKTGTLYAIDAISQEIAWSTQTIGEPSMAPVTEEGWNIVFIGTEEGWVQAFSIITGNLVWQDDVGDAVADIAVDWDRAYAITIEGNLTAWAASPGEEIGTYAFESAPNALFTNGEMLLVSTQEGELRYLDVERAEEEEPLELDEALIGTPTFIGQSLFVRTKEAIYEFER